MAHDVRLLALVVGGSGSKFHCFQFPLEHWMGLPPSPPPSHGQPATCHSATSIPTDCGVMRRKTHMRISDSIQPILTPTTSTSETTRKKYDYTRMPSPRATTECKREDSNEKQASSEGKQQEQKSRLPSSKKTTSSSFEFRSRF